MIGPQKGHGTTAAGIVLLVPPPRKRSQTISINRLCHGFDGLATKMPCELLDTAIDHIRCQLIFDFSQRAPLAPQLICELETSAFTQAIRRQPPLCFLKSAAIVPLFIRKAA